MADASTKFIISKNNVINQEYAIFTNSSDELCFGLYDDSENAVIGRKTAAITAYENTWVHIVCTYDGSQASSGVKIYIAGTQAPVAASPAVAQQPTQQQPASTATAGVVPTWAQ